MAREIEQMGLGQDLWVSSPQEIPSNIPECPIYVCMPPFELENFLGKVSSSFPRIEDFCFLTGGLAFGNIEDVLKDRGYLRDSTTQILVSELKIDCSDRVKDTRVQLATESAVGEQKLAGECSAC